MGSTAVSDQPQPPQPQQRAPTESRTISPSPSRTTREGSTFSTTTRSKRLVITAPPWASHEQPVPDEEFLSPTSAFNNGTKPHSNSSHERMPSDIASFTSSQEPPHTGNWWTFTGTRNGKVVVEDPGETEDTSSPEASEDLERGSRPTRLHKPRPTMKQRNPSSWIFGAALNAVGSRKKGKASAGPNEGSGDEEGGAEEEEEARHRPSDVEEVAEEDDTFDEAGPSIPVKPKARFVKRMMPRRGSSNLLRLDLPLPPAPFTKAQTETPGWDSPWNPRKYLQEPLRAYSRDGPRPAREATETSRTRSLGRRSDVTSPDLLGSHIEKNETGSLWKRRTRTLRTWCLQNIYVPLLFRILNLAFTSATLGIAIGIRRTETRYDVLGILGPSATITIIFAPVTLVHVIISIYLEYFGRPVGLWKTSAKLTLTLIEIVLICAWSSSLAICFNDYVTTSLKCGPRSIDRWWSDLPAPENPLTAKQQQNGAGTEMCEQQAALISMAMVTLMSYCSNLVISLFRIIEKVKSYSTHKRVNWR